MLLMTEKGIRGGRCEVIDRCAKTNHKYMKNYDKNIESSYLVYLICKEFIWMGNVSKITNRRF